MSAPVLVTLLFAASHASHDGHGGPGCDQAIRLLGLTCVVYALGRIGLYGVALAIVLPPALLVVVGCMLQVGLTRAVLPTNTPGSTATQIHSTGRAERDGRGSDRAPGGL